MAEQEQPDKAAWEGEMFRLLAENVKDYAIFVVDAHRHVLSWSKGAERLLGFSEAEIVGKQCDCFFTPDDVRRGVPQQELEQALATGRGEDDRWQMRKDGSRFWASGAMTPLKDAAGRLRGFAKIMRDRTEMKRAEEAAHERERQLQLLTDHAPVLIAHCDTDRRYKFVNKPYAARFNLHPREIVGRHIRDVMGGPAYAAIERFVTAALAGERVEFEVEVPYDGLGPQVMRCAYDPELDAGGQVAGFVAAVVNVTESRQAREALRESEERLRTLSDNLPHGAVYQVLGEAEGRRWFTYISAGVERLLGVTPAEALADANALYGLVHEEDRPRVAAQEETARRDLAPFDCEFRSWTRGGDVRWVHARSAPRRLPTGQTVWEGIIMDVTDRKRAEADLARLTAESDHLRRLYETALSNTIDFNYTFDLDGRFTYVNESLLALWGKETHEAVGKNFFDLDYLPTLADRLQRQIRQVIDTRQPLRDETAYTSRLGTREYEYIFVPVFEAGGAVEAVAGSTRDITDRKALEVKLRDQAEQLRQADRRKDEFLAMLAHELRNPLAPIRNAAQVIRLLGTTEPNVQRSTELIERQVQHMTRLVDDLLDVSRITSGKIKLQKEPVELAAVVARAVETVRPLIEARRHQLAVALPPEAVRLEADPTRLAQVVANLLTNAAKYTDEAGGIWLTAEREGETVVVCVRDSGVGIPGEMLPKVFDLFTQVDGSLARSEGGLGIGLTLVKSLTELHGGTVAAKSEGPGRGSEFVVRLPVLQTPHAPNVGKAQRTAAGHSPPRRILVVDDNVDAAESLALLLRVGQHDVRTAHDGLTALQVAETFRPEVVLLDIGLPRMDGFEVARRLHEQPGMANALLVALTGYGQEEDRRRSHEAGFDRHLVKPADPAALQAILASFETMERKGARP